MKENKNFEFAVYLPSEVKVTTFEDIENGVYESLYDEFSCACKAYAPLPSWCELSDRYKYFSEFGDERFVYIFFETEEDAKAAWDYWSDKYDLDYGSDDWNEFYDYLESRA